MPEATDVVGVLRVHLDEIRMALDWSRGHFSALDLADSYRQGKPSLRPGRATAMVEKALSHVDGYLQTDQEGSEP